MSNSLSCQSSWFDAAFRVSKSYCGWNIEYDTALSVIHTQPAAAPNAAVLVVVAADAILTFQGRTVAVNNFPCFICRALLTLLSKSAACLTASYGALACRLNPTPCQTDTCIALVADVHDVLL